jgi:ribosome-binding protein aMBF1 (putative translation factor)
MPTQTRTRKRKSRKADESPRRVPILPPADVDGYYPAAETLQVIIARQIHDRRRIAGLSQVELAKRAGVRQETVSRLESGKHAPTVRTVEKIDRALLQAGA